MPMQLEAREGSNRIAYLDGLRCVAILLVILYHYFSHWTMPHYVPSLYPYGSSFERIFAYGGFGVQLFFLISGFVIAMTLPHCADFRTFLVKRWARLWPTLALCAAITYVCEDFLIPNRVFHLPARSFLPSLTFLDPKLFWIVLHDHSFQWIDGSYWSLYAEVRFYLIIAFFYFYARRHFARNLALVAAAHMLIGWWSMHAGEHRYLQVKLLLGAEYFPWFMIGVAFFWRRIDSETFYRNVLLGISIAALLGDAYLLHEWANLACVLLIAPLAWLAGRSMPVNRLLSHRVFTSVGQSSYSLYLLHQHIGVALIGWVGLKLKLAGPGSAWLAVATMGVMMMAAHLIYTRWETPIHHALSQRLLRMASRKAGTVMAKAELRQTS